MIANIDEPSASTEPALRLDAQLRQKIQRTSS
jgi:hypothetical protein